jgi:hypothetical protein
MAAERLLQPDGLRMPTLEQLGPGLLTTTARQRWIALLRPYAGVALFTVAATAALWWAAPPPVPPRGRPRGLPSQPQPARRTLLWTGLPRSPVVVDVPPQPAEAQPTHLDDRRELGLPVAHGLPSAPPVRDTPLTQTRTLRGRVVPAIFLELTYHLEHHLYPQVPSHNLPELARRLDPFLQRAGVQAWYVI